MIEGKSEEDARRSDVGAPYAPPGAHEFNETLIELRFKAKSSPPMQVADLYLWPIAMHRYGRGGLPYERFRQSGRLIETQLTEAETPVRGSKYSCFELVDAVPQNNKGPDVNPSL